MDIGATLRRSVWLLIGILIIALLEEATGLAALSVLALFMSGLLFMLFYWIAISYIALIREKESYQDVKEHIISVEQESTVSVEEIPSLEQG